MRSRFRFWLWLGLLAGFGFLLWNLHALFPDAFASTLDDAYFFRMLAVLMVVSGAIVYAPAMRASEVFRNIALWTAIAGVLVLGYTFRSELEEIGLRVRSELVPGYPVSTAPDTIALSVAEDGGYHVMGLVDGTPVEFMVDTGASDIVLTPADAARIGLDPKLLDYSRGFETAHGIGRGASVRVASLAVGPIAFSDVDVSVNQTPMRNSLLGMAFLKRLDSFEVKGNRLLLRWRK
jgi:aspartyl protease family protein